VAPQPEGLRSSRDGFVQVEAYKRSLSEIGTQRQRSRVGLGLPAAGAGAAAVAAAPGPAAAAKPGVCAAKPVAEGTSSTPSGDGYAAFVCKVSDVALAQGATSYAAILAAMLTAHETPGSPQDRALVERLERAGLATQHGGRLVAAEAMILRAKAWRGVLDGQLSDLGVCGDETLDEWALRLLRPAVSEVEASASALKQALRRRGVAAFGLRKAA
jgi:hypothetical protein